MSMKIIAFLAALLSGPSDDATTIHEFRIDVDGATIRVLCTDGPRRVVLMHGASSQSDIWRPVLQRLDGEVGACAWDRRGNGNSFPGPGERGWYEFLEEMRAVHRTLGFGDDAVLVGHSLGGLYARLFAIESPTALSGLVLVDPSHEDMVDKIRPGMPPLQWARLNRIREIANEDGLVENQLADQLRGQRLPGIPVTVLTASIRPDGGGYDARFLNEAAREVHASVLRGVALGRHIPASRSGHDVHLDEPDLVAEEILRVVALAR
ncbi:MAG: alpha/beta hydrolase [Gemmatimonadota bacterium]